MLRCPMAAKAPRIMEATATKMMICRQSPIAAGKAPTKTRTVIAIAAILGAAAKKAVTAVGEPS